MSLLTLKLSTAVGLRDSGNMLRLQWKKISRFWLKFLCGHLEEFHSPVTLCSQSWSLSLSCGTLARNLCSGQPDVQPILKHARFLSMDSITVPDARASFHGTSAMPSRLSLSPWELYAFLIPFPLSQSLRYSPVLFFAGLLPPRHRLPPTMSPRRRARRAHVQVQETLGFLTTEETHAIIVLSIHVAARF